MKKITLATALLEAICFILAQVGIGTYSPASLNQLENLACNKT